MIGVLMSATLPARLGEPARAMVLARRTGRMREALPVLLGTLVSQTALNLVALALLGSTIVLTTDLFHSSQEKLFIVSLAPLALLVALILAPTVMRGTGSGRVARVLEAIRSAGSGPKRPEGLPRPPPRVVRRRGAARRVGGPARLLLRALGRDEARGRAGIGACAAVLFAVNVTAVVPATPRTSACSSSP